ncbi:hypothetical protein F4803DRAFT_565917 [Xylaria telfairii]|nr:hypothetical protein F4803DRAFT_565917 [Xylaria telfairii]
MGVPPSKVALSKNSSYASVFDGASAGEGTRSQQQLSSTRNKVSSTLKSPSSSCPSVLDIFESSQNTDGKTPETAITINSDSEEEPSTPINNRSEHHVSENESDDEIHGNKLRKIRQPTSRSRGRKRPRPIDAEHGDNAGKSNSRTQSSHTNKRGKSTIPGPLDSRSSSSKNNRKRPYAHGPHDIPGAHKTDSPRPTKKSRVTSQITPQITRSLSLPPYPQKRHSNIGSGENKFSFPKVQHQIAGSQPKKENEGKRFQINHSLGFNSGIRSAASTSLHRENTTTRANNEDPGVDNQTIKPQTKRSHKANRSRLARFRQANRVHPDTVSEPDIVEEPQQGRYITARVDSRELLQETRPLTTTSAPRIYKPQLGRLNVTNRTRNINRRVYDPLALNHPTLDDLFHKHHHQLSPPRTQSEERNAALVQKFQNQQRPREYVVPELKWGYTIKYIDSAEIILDDEDRKEKTMTDRMFADRKMANEYLHKKTSPDAVGGLEAIANRTTTLEGPERLLKADITLTNGEHYLMWVERSMIVLSDLKEERRRQAQWQPTPRPTLSHYTVTCDLITYDTNRVTRCEEDEEASDAMSASELGSSGLEITLRIEKLPLKTFTIREMANDYAGKLFLQRTRVDKQFAKPSDVHWWKCNALPEHKRAVLEARKPGGLYEIAMKAHDMNCRLGWDQILVHVHEVDDIDGPVNF